MAFWNSLMPMDAVHAWGWTLIHFAWQGCFIALAAAVGLQILKRASSAVKYAFLLAAFALMAMSPGVTFFWMESPQPGDLAIAAEELPDEIVAAPVSPGGVVELPFIDDTMGDDVTVALTPMMDQDRAGIAVSPLPFDTPSRSAEEGVEERLMEWMPLLVLFWALGVVVLSLRLLWSWYRLRQLLQRQLNRLSAEWNSRLDDIQNRLRLRRKVDTFSSGLAAVPMVIGWVRPAILIPASLLTSLSPRELEALLAHELAHLRRWDDVVNLLQSLVETVLFYHPAVWWLSRKLREERENCCDDIAADVIGDRVAYSRALLAAAEHATGSSNSLALAATGSDLTQRIRRLLNAESLGQPRSFWPLIAILLLSVGVGGAMALAQGIANGEKPTEETVAKDKNNEPEQREPVKTDWTVAEILEGINQTRERYRHAEYRSVSTQLRDANSFRPDAEEKWQQWIIDVDFRSDGERWDIARKAVHWNLEDGDNADRITENHRSVFDGKQHLTRERDVLTIGQEDSALKLNSPAEEFWRVGKNFSWLSGPLKADTAKVVGVDTSGPFPLVKILSRKESYGENEAPFDYDITISPQQSFLPVDVQITRDGKLDVSWTMFDLQKTQIGDWYPAKMEIEQGLVFPIKKETVKIFDFEIGKEYVASDFDASIPLGVDVVDHTSGTVYFNDPWWPEIGEWMENRFGWPPRRLSSLRELGSFTDGTIDGQPVPETAVSEWINGDPGPFHDPENVTLLFCFGGRLIDPTPRWWAGLKKLHDRYRDHPIRIVGLATDDAPEATRQLVEELRLPYSVGIDQASEDGGQGYGKTRDRFGMRTYTGIVAIDREGIVHTLDNPPNAGGGEPPLESLVRTLLGIEKPYEDPLKNGLAIGPFRETIRKWQQLRQQAPKESVITGKVLNTGLTKNPDYSQVKVSLTPELRLVSGDNPSGHMVNNPKTEPTLTTTCEADGSFRFDGLPKGLYWLSINSKFGDEKKAVAVGERESATVELSAAQIPEAKETTAINESGPTGTLTGRFVWEGRRPRLPLLVTPNKDYPGGVADESLQIGKDGGVAGVVVWLSDKEFPAVTPPPGKPEKLVMGKSGFQPRVLAFHAPHELTIFQQMTEVSNARYEGFRKSFNVQLNPKTFRTVDVAPERLPMLIHSDIHPWMSGYLFPVEHPYFAVTAADGSFQIPDIPVGEWNFSVWHERSGYLRWDDFDGRRHPIKIEKGANSLPERKLNAEQLHVDMKSMADDVTNRTHWGVGERVTGRVVDHVGKPVPKARVLLVGDAIVHVDLQADREKLGWERDQPGHVDSTLTDADGAFSLDRSNKPGTRMVIISEDLALWSLPAWEFPDSGAITLPEPGTLTVDLNLPGDSPKASFSLEQVDGPWDYVSSGTGTSSSSWRAGWAISNPGSVRIEHLPPGRYLVKRRDVVRMSEKRLIVSEAEETLIELSPGDSKLVSFDRQTGLPVSGTVTDVPAEYLPETVVRAAMRSVHLVDRRFDQAFTNTIEQVVVDDQGRFTFDRLPAGEHQFSFHADHGTRPNDYYFGGVKVTIPVEGEPLEVQLPGTPNPRAREALMEK